MRRKITIGSRGSRLALLQAESVMTQIAGFHPELEINITKITTKGDRSRHTPLDRMPGVGVFVKELEEALFQGRIDLAVHSLKDVPTEIPEGLCLLAVTGRLDPRDVLVSRCGRLDELAAGSRIGTGSLRRAVQLKAHRPDLKALSIRGNVDTRLRKVAEGEFDGVILAAAALKRLGREEKITDYLPPEHFLPAVGQGALVIEARRDDAEIAAPVSPLNHGPTGQSVTAERAFLRALGGGCRAPIAALGTVNGTSLSLEGMVARVSDGQILRATEAGDSQAPEALGIRLAQRLLQMGAAEFIAEARDIESG